MVATIFFVKTRLVPRYLHLAPTRGPMGVMRQCAGYRGCNQLPSEQRGFVVDGPARKTLCHSRRSVLPASASLNMSRGVPRRARTNLHWRCSRICCAILTYFLARKWPYFTFRLNFEQEFTFVVGQEIILAIASRLGLYLANVPRLLAYSTPVMGFTHMFISSSRQWYSTGNNTTLNQNKI